MEHLPFVITIVGPESSGKSTLAEVLADKLQAQHVPEYAREYLMSISRPYDRNDLMDIARGQWEMIERATHDSHQGKSINLTPEKLLNLVYSLVPSQRVLPFSLQPGSQITRPIIVVDSGMLNLRMWARIRYNWSIPMVEEKLAHDITSLYLLLRPLTHWTPDPLREAPSLLERAWIYNQYLAELASLLRRT